MLKAGWLSSLVGTVLLVALGSAVGRLQEPHSTLRIAADGIDELRQWDPVIDRLTSERTLRTRTVYDDSLIPGRRHEGLIQYYRGVPVYGGDVTRQTDRGATVSIFGTIYVGIDLDPSPRLTPADARRIVATLSDAAIVGPDEPALVILPTMDGRYALAYRSTVRSAITYFLDARDGRVLMEVDEIKHQAAVGRGRGALGDIKKMSTTMMAGTYRSQDGLRPAPVITLDTRGSAANFARLIQGGRWLESDVAVDADNDWTQPAVVDAHAHMGWTYDYFFKSHRYQGLNDRNAPIIGVVAARTLFDSAAFARPPFGPDGGGGMVFGELPSGVPLSLLDVTAHELMHGVSFFSVSRRAGRGLGGLPVGELGPASIVVGGRSLACEATTFGGQPFLCDGGRYVLVSDPAGAINEGLSDIFGTAVEFAYQPAGNGVQRAEYAMGEDLPEIGILVRGQAGPLRSLQDPRSLALEGEPTGGVAYPDHYSRRVTFGVVVLPDGRLAVVPAAIVGSEGFTLSDIDDGGVHWNSTILSHAYYLAVEGGQNRTSGRTVQGVGAGNRIQIEQVFFRAVRDLLPSSVTFVQVGAILRQAAIDTHGASSAATRAVDQALAAVGL